MGGKDEGYVEPATSKKTAEKTIVPAERPAAKASPAQPAGPARAATVVEESPVETGPRRYRYHESNGQIHFHGVGDEANLKAAIPVAEWFLCWQRMARLERYEYVDLDNKTVFTAESFVENGVADVFLQVQPVQVGGALAALSDFTAKRR